MGITFNIQSSFESTRKSTTVFTETTGFGFKGYQQIQIYRKRDINLKVLGNQISAITPENFKGLEDSLQKLILADNSLLYIPRDAFTGLSHLNTIDLSGNHLREIDPSVFREGMGRLENLILADNELMEIPYEALAPLTALKVLDLRYNQIERVEPKEASQVLNFKINLNLLQLDYNEINILTPAAFQNFAVVNITYLDGNILAAVQVVYSTATRMYQRLLQHFNHE